MKKLDQNLHYLVALADFCY